MKKSVPFADETRIVGLMDEDVADETARGSEPDPAATTDVVAVIAALQGELGEGGAVP